MRAFWSRGGPTAPADYGLLFVLCLIVLSGAVRAGGAEVVLKTSVDRDSVLIADPVSYTIEVQAPASLRVEPPPPGKQFGPFEVRDYQILPAEEADDEPADQPRSTLIRWLLVPYQTGRLEIPAVALAVTDSSGAVDTVRAGAYPIEVVSLEPDMQGGIRDIKPPMTLPGGRAWIWWLVGGLLAVVGGFIIYRRLLRKRFDQALDGIAYQGPPRPAHEIALEELDRIVVLNLLGRGLIKQFYTEISETIKRYIARRYRIQTMELTTSELLAGMHEGDVPEEHIAAFKPFFEECDLVKFAKYIPSREKMDTTLEGARQLVFSTMERQTAVEPELEVAAPAET